MHQISCLLIDYQFVEVEELLETAREYHPEAFARFLRENSCCSTDMNGLAYWFLFQQEVREEKDSAWDNHADTLFRRLVYDFALTTSASKIGPRDQLAFVQKIYIKNASTASVQAASMMKMGATFSEVLDFLRFERKRIAYCQKDANFEDYGMENPMSGFLNSDLNYCIRKHKQRISPRVEAVLHVAITGVIHGERIPLTAISIVAPDRHLWQHTQTRFWPKIKKRLNEFYDQIIEETDPQKVIEDIARFQWWFCHACPFKRGTAGIVEMNVSAMLVHKGLHMKLKSGSPPMDLIALTSPSEEEFIARFKDSYEERDIIDLF